MNIASKRIMRTFNQTVKIKCDSITTVKKLLWWRMYSNFGRINNIDNLRSWMAPTRNFRPAIYLSSVITERYDSISFVWLSSGQSKSNYFHSLSMPVCVLQSLHCLIRIDSISFALLFSHKHESYLIRFLSIGLPSRMNHHCWFHFKIMIAALIPIPMRHSRHIIH